MAIVLRGTKGTALTYNEADENWDFLERTKHNRLDVSYEGIYNNAKVTVNANGEIVAIETSGGDLTPGIYENPIITVDDSGGITDIVSASGELPPGEYVNPIITIGSTGFISNIATATGSLPPGTYQNAIITIGTNGFISNVTSGEDVKIIDSFEFTGNAITTVDSTPIRLLQSVNIDGGPLVVRNNALIDGNVNIGGNVRITGNNVVTGALEFYGSNIRTNDSSPLTVRQAMRVTGDLIVDNEFYCDDIRTSARWFKHGEPVAGRNTGGTVIWMTWTNRGIIHQDSEVFEFQDDNITVLVRQSGLYRLTANVTFNFTTTTGLNIDPIQLQLYDRSNNEVIARAYAEASRGDTYISTHISTIHRLDEGDLIGLRAASADSAYVTTGVGDFSIEWAGYSRS